MHRILLLFPIFFMFFFFFKCFFLNLYCLAHTADISLFLCSMNGALAFVDSSDCTIMYIAEHYMASDVEWDPTGRYVVTSVSWWSHKVIWHVHLIKLIYVYPQSFFFHILMYSVYRWTMHTGFGRFRDVFCKRTTKTDSASCYGDHALLHYSVRSK